MSVQVFLGIIGLKKKDRNQVQSLFILRKQEKQSCVKQPLSLTSYERHVPLSTKDSVILHLISLKHLLTLSSVLPSALIYFKIPYVKLRKTEIQKWRWRKSDRGTDGRQYNRAVDIFHTETFLQTYCNTSQTHTFHVTPASQPFILAASLRITTTQLKQKAPQKTENSERTWSCLGVPQTT